ncbi:Uncharacterised protein [Orientia tsutsugamushi]|uniref:Uncharacterized protein n=1 Tax=Orientia tsutsugamushi TaxID=784 RepID=A0A2U3RTG4_ORITS|nr:hypothetical protein OTSKARP_0466 [Orientia tsutsugamushi str. Karp]SPR16509.1 Uncharacterised protein [Orientia tsutsugamushi]
MNQEIKEFKINAATLYLYLENKVIKTVMKLVKKLVIRCFLN